MRSAFILAVLVATARFAAASEALPFEDLEDDEPLEIDAVTGSREAVARPDPEPRIPTVTRHDDGLVFRWDGAGPCFELRLVRSYDGREVLAMSFAHDGRCEQPAEGVTPTPTP